MLPHSLTVVPIFWSYPRAATQLDGGSHVSGSPHAATQLEVDCA